MYAIVVARYLWRKQLINRRAVLFVDNWAVLDSYIPGTSRERSWRQLLSHIERIDMEMPCYIRATRVPSESNIADPPSRGTLKGLEFLGDPHIDIPRCPILDVALNTCC